MNENQKNLPWNVECEPFRIFEPQCQAEILHWFGRDDISCQQKEDAIATLMNFEEGCGGFYRYRAYFLAAEALVYFPNSRRGDEIVRQLLCWSYAYFQTFPDWEKFPTPLVRLAQQVLARTDKKRAIAAFVEKVRTTPNQFVLRHAAEQLGKLDPGNKTAIAALVLLLQIAEKPSTIWKALRSLIAIDPENSAIAPTAIALAEKRPAQFYHLRESIEILGTIGKGNRTAIDTLIRLTQITSRDILDRSFYSDLSEEVREKAADALGKIAVSDETAIAMLTEIVQAHPNVAIQYAAAASLSAIDPGNTIAISALVQALETLPYSDYRTPEEIDITLKNRGLRWLAAERLAETDNYREVAIGALQALVYSAWFYPEPPALESLVKIDPNLAIAYQQIKLLSFLKG